jgi:hypothetical protein
MITYPNEEMIMKKITQVLLVLNLILFNAMPSSAIRFHPSLTDQDVWDLGQKYPSVGTVCERLTDSYDGNIIDVPVHSTGTLISLPNMDELNGSLILVANHAFNNWGPQSDNFTFTLNGEKRRIVNYISAPSEELIETYYCFFSYSSILQRDCGFAVLEAPITDIKPAPLCLDNFFNLPSENILTTVGFGNAGRLDSSYCFHDVERRAMQVLVSEFDVATIENGIEAKQGEIPLRLEHMYRWDFSISPTPLVRGSIENCDSGGPVFWGETVIGVAKGSGFANGLEPKNNYIFDKAQIEILKTNDKLPNDLCLTANPSFWNSTSYLIESLGGASDWITEILPKQLLQTHKPNPNSGSPEHYKQEI